MNNFINRLVQSGQSALEVVLNAEEILKINELKLPSCYDKTRAGGKFEIRLASELYKEIFQLGGIPYRNDPDFGSKKKKYEKFAHKKNNVLNNPGIIFSEDGEFEINSQKYQVAGGIKFSHNLLDNILLSFSGRHEYVDQLIILLIAFDRNLCNINFIKNTYEEKQNPFLEWKIFKALFAAME